MAEQLIISKEKSKEDRYKDLIPQLESLIGGEKDCIANLANVTAALKQVFDFYWVGFYIVKDIELILGPFQGTIACTRIKYGKGVCGTAWKEKRALVVPDVNDFPGHIACDSRSRSEIVIPVTNEEKEIVAVLDIDSEFVNNFDCIDVLYLEKIVSLLGKYF